MLKTNTQKAKECLYHCSYSQSQIEAFYMKPKNLSAHYKFKTAPSTCLRGVLSKNSSDRLLDVSLTNPAWSKKLIMDFFFIDNYSFFGTW